MKIQHDAHGRRVKPDHQAGDMMPTRTKRVLIVDDDHDIRQTLHLMLADEGYQVETAADGDAALRILGASRDPLPVFLDVMMPRVDGVEVLRTVANDPNLKRHVFTLMTAAHRTLPMDLVRLIQQLDVDIIWKPFEDITMIPLALLKMEQRLH
jgi:CheY-like chemotaxis protein